MSYKIQYNILKVLRINSTINLTLYNIPLDIYPIFCINDAMKFIADI